MVVRYHVSSSLNRESIRSYGLDWRRMGAARGIAGSRCAEQQGCFLVSDEFDVEWFIGMNNTGRPVDVWEVDGVGGEAPVQSPEGYLAHPGTIEATRLRLTRVDIGPRDFDGL